jgi:hypothetical protein
MNLNSKKKRKAFKIVGNLQRLRILEEILVVVIFIKILNKNFPPIRLIRISKQF